MPVLVVLRRLLLMVGSVSIAWLAVSLVAGTALGLAALDSPMVGVAVIVLGGLIYREIRRREAAPA